MRFIELRTVVGTLLPTMGDSPQLSSMAIREIERALANLSDAQADRVAVLLAERGPLAGTLNPPWEEREPQTRVEVEALVIAVFDQHALEATEPGREDSDLAMLSEAVADVEREG